MLVEHMKVGQEGLTKEGDKKKAMFTLLSSPDLYSLSLDLTKPARFPNNGFIFNSKAHASSQTLLLFCRPICFKMIIDASY